MSPAVLEFKATPAAQHVIDALGRTEDLKFSPSRQRLAIAAFERNHIAVFSVFIESGNDGPEITLSDPVVFTSRNIDQPHGLAFINEEILVVANRNQFVSIFCIPGVQSEVSEQSVKPLRVVWRNRLRPLHSPGSVAVYRTAASQYRLLICDNYSHKVVSGLLNSRRRFLPSGHRTLLAKSLDIPDGVCISENRKWIAISNHTPGTVFIYRNTPELKPNSDPIAVLHGMDCPHGICFTDRDRKLIIADSATPFVHVYACEDDQWVGEYQPFRVHRVLDEDTFQRGRHNIEEGGTKGIDVHSNASVVALTNEHQPLRFFCLESFLQ